MTDQTLICQNCHGEFVWSSWEQQKQGATLQQGRTLPKYCLICRSTKHQATKMPPKPKNDKISP